MKIEHLKKALTCDTVKGKKIDFFLNGGGRVSHIGAAATVCFDDDAGVVQVSNSETEVYQHHVDIGQIAAIYIHG